MTVPVWGNKRVKRVTIDEIDASGYEFFIERLNEYGTAPASFAVKYVPMTKLGPTVKRMTGDWDDSDWDFVEGIKKDMKRGFTIPPVILSTKGELVDGRHRVMAAAALRIKEVPAIVENWI